MGKPVVCNLCGDRPIPVKQWHDKENRVFNHIPWTIRCKCGFHSVRDSTRNNVIREYNASVRTSRQICAVVKKPMDDAPLKNFIQRLSTRFKKLL